MKSHMDMLPPVNKVKKQLIEFIPGLKIDKLIHNTSPSVNVDQNSQLPIAPHPGRDGDPIHLDNSNVLSVKQTTDSPPLPPSPVGGGKESRSGVNSPVSFNSSTGQRDKITSKKIITETGKSCPRSIKYW